MDNFIKKLLPAFILFFYFIAGAAAQQKKFIRVYLTGPAKVVKGYYGGHTDSSLIILANQQRVTMSYVQIQNIRTAKTVGHSILIGSVTGAFVGAITGLVTHKDPEPPPANCWFCITFETTPAENAAAGFTIGAMAGALVGTVSGFAKKKENLTIAGDFANWKTIIARLDAWPVYNSETTSK